MPQHEEAPSVRLYLFSEPRRSRWTMLKCFGALRMALRRGFQGLHFVRALGCGQGIGFSLLPDLSRYAVLAVGPDAALDSFESSMPMKNLGVAARSLEIYDLVPLQGHGYWDGEQPFRPGEPPAPGAPLAVITRARIPLRGVLNFIRHSQRVTSALAAAPGRIFSIGIGELPFVRQATFSVWPDPETIVAFAYQDSRHREAVAATRRHRLFSEELFWRFAIRGFIKRPLG